MLGSFNSNIRFFIILIWFQLNIFESTAQTTKCTEPWIFEKGNLDLIWTTQFSPGDTIYKKSKNGTLYKIAVESCDGVFTFEEFSLDTLVKLKSGSYSQSLDTLARLYLAVNSYGKNLGYQVERHFQPMKSGLWLYFNKDGKVIRRELYYEGILLNPSGGN
jgi:hypothetical protein